MKTSTAFALLGLNAVFLAACQSGGDTINSDQCVDGICLQDLYVENHGGDSIFWADVITEEGKPIDECPSKGFTLAGKPEIKPMMNMNVGGSNRVIFECDPANLHSESLLYSPGNDRSAVVGHSPDFYREGLIGSVITIEIYIADKPGGYIFEYEVPPNGEITQAAFIEKTLIYTWPDYEPDFTPEECAVVEEDDIIQLSPVGHYSCIIEAINRVVDLTVICNRYPETEQCNWLP